MGLCGIGGGATAETNPINIERQNKTLWTTKSNQQQQQQQQKEKRRRKTKTNKKAQRRAAGEIAGNKLIEQFIHSMYNSSPHHNCQIYYNFRLKYLYRKMIVSMSH